MSRGGNAGGIAWTGTCTTGGGSDANALDCGLQCGMPARSAASSQLEVFYRGQWNGKVVALIANDEGIAASRFEGEFMPRTAYARCR